MNGDAVLIAAQSGRALAGSARRAGYRPLVADLFCDLDTQAAAERCAVAGDWQEGFRGTRLRATLAALAEAAAPVGLVYGSGFEDRPALLRALGRCYRLLGNSADVVSRAKNPLGFAALCREHGIPHPATAMTEAEGWLSKRIGGAGGGHIVPARGSRRARPGRYAQLRVEGRPVSAMFLADGHIGTLLGFSAQWSDPLPRRPYRYGGAVRPAAVPAARAAAMTEVIGWLIPALGLRGLNSADFLLREDGFNLIEINPRPGATLDIHPDAGGALFHAHVAACQGRLPPPLPIPPGAAAACVVYAPRAISVPENFVWPAWAADRQPPNSAVAEQAPFCTVRAEADDAEAAVTLLTERARHIVEMTRA